MGFDSEEEIDSWLLSEKEKLENDFLKSISKDKENIPKHREKYDAGMKRMLAKYENESIKLLASIRKKSLQKK